MVGLYFLLINIALVFWSEIGIALFLSALVLSIWLKTPKKFIAIIAVLFIAFLTGSYFYTRFDSSAWLENGSQDNFERAFLRLRMADDLIASKRLMGKSHLEVQHTLGTPDAYGPFAMGLAPAWRYYIDLNETSKQALIVRFSEQGVVIKVEIGSYYGQ